MDAASEAQVLAQCAGLRPAVTASASPNCRITFALSALFECSSRQNGASPHDERRL